MSLTLWDLRWAIRGEAIAFNLMVLWLLVRFGYRIGRQRYQASRRETARAALVEVIAGHLTPANALAMRGISKRSRMLLIGGAAALLSGESLERVRSFGKVIGLVQSCVRDCRSIFWWKRLHGLRFLANVGAGEECIPNMIFDSHPLIRAEATSWMAEHPTPERVRMLVSRLDEPSRIGKFALQDALLRIGDSVSQPIVDYLEEASTDGTAAALQVARGLASPKFLEPALVRSRNQSAFVRLASARLLGALGGEKAVLRLLDLTTDPEASVRAVAAQSLGKLKLWKYAGDLAELLKDRAWEVRRAAAMALRELGSPGVIYLQQAEKDEDRFAADMARHILSLPEGATQ